MPVQYRFPQIINTVEINNAVDWRRKHLQAIITNYSKAPFFKDYIGLFEETYSKKWEFLSQLNVYLIEKIREILALNRKQTVLASDLNLGEDPTDRLIDICKTLGGDTYLAGKDGAKYMELKRFSERGIKVIFQDFTHPGYSQLFGDFQPNLSIIDLLFNCGSESMQRISSCNISS